MPHKEKENKHLWQEMEFRLNLLDKEDPWKALDQGLG